MKTKFFLKSTFCLQFWKIFFKILLSQNPRITFSLQSRARIIWNRQSLITFYTGKGNKLLARTDLTRSGLKSFKVWNFLQVYVILSTQFCWCFEQKTLVSALKAGFEDNFFKDCHFLKTFSTLSVVTSWFSPHTWTPFRIKVFCTFFGKNQNHNFPFTVWKEA